MSDVPIEELLKIPAQHQTKEAIDKLWARRKELGDLFYDKTKPAKERNAVFDEYNKISTYLGAKTIQWRVKESGQGGGRRQVTKEDRITNCSELKQFLIKEELWRNLEPFQKAYMLAQAWGPP